MRIYIDDVRPCPDGWVLVRTFQELKDLFIKTVGEEIEEISFDHDLGDGHTGYDMIRWLSGNRNRLSRYPKKTSVHSMNPIGRKRIEDYDHYVRTVLIPTLDGGNNDKHS